MAAAKPDGAIEKVRDICGSVREALQNAEVRQANPEMEAALYGLEHLLPKILVCGGQNVGKSQLLNRLMPPCLGGKVQFPVATGTASRNVTTIHFVRDAANQVELQMNPGAKKDTHRIGTSDDDLGLISQQIAAWLSEVEKRVKDKENEKMKARGVADANCNDAHKSHEDYIFFDSAPVIFIKHQSIEQEYTLTDMPGLRGADSTSGPIITAKLDALLPTMNLVIAVGNATEDPNNWPVLDRVAKMPEEVACYLVFNKADMLVDDSLSTFFNNAETWPYVEKYAVTSAVKDPADELAALAPRVAALPSSLKRIVGCANLLEMIERFYGELVTKNMPKVEAVAITLTQTISTAIRPLEMLVRPTLDPLRLALTIHNDQVDPITGDKGEGTFLDGQINRAKMARVEKWHNRKLAEFLSNPKRAGYLADRIDKCNTNGVADFPGTEGLYDYVRSIYKNLGEIFIKKLVKELKVVFEDIKTAVITELQKQMPSTLYARALARYTLAISNVDVNKILDAVDGTDENPGAMLQPPRHPTGYPHNYFAKTTYTKMNRELQALREKAASPDATVSVADIDAIMHGSLHDIFKISNLQDAEGAREVLLENVRNCVTWYWANKYHGVIATEIFARLDDLTRAVRLAVAAEHASILQEPTCIMAVATDSDIRTLKVLEDAHEKLRVALGPNAPAAYAPAEAPPRATQIQRVPSHDQYDLTDSD